MPSLTRFPLSFLTPGLLAIALAGCTGAPASDGGTEPGSTPAASGPRDMLVIAAGSDANILVPHVSSSAGDSQVFAHIYMDGTGSDFDCKLNFTPALYESWDWSDDSLELTFTMRKDIKWADGTALTAHDVAFAYERIADKKEGSPRYGYTLDYAKLPEALDDYTVKFTWKEPGDRLTRLSQSSLYHAPKHLLKDVPPGTIPTHPLASNPVPNGPFTLGKRQKGKYFTLVPNEKFTGPEEMKPKLKVVRYEIIPEYQTRLLKLKKGEVDLMESIKVKDADELKKTNPNIRLVRRGYRFMDYIAWNLNDDRFKDKQVRKAMAHAVDVDGMIKRLLTAEDGTAYATQSVGTITPEICATKADFPPIKQDLEKAKQMLADAGWTDTNANGVVDKDGVELSFTLMTNRENERRQQAAQLVQSQLKEIGVEMNIDLVEFNAMTKRAKERDFEAMLGGWAAGLFIDPSAFWHSGEEYIYNYTSYNNPEVDALIDKGLATPDPEAAAPIWKEMQEKIYEDQPYMFLWWQDSIVGIDERFQNTNIDILSVTSDLPKWEVPPDKVKYPL